MKLTSLLSTVSLAIVIAGASAAAQAQIAIGHLEDLSGGTSDVGTPYGQAVVDTFAWVNKNGGVGGKQLAVDSNDYGYKVPQAIALYKKFGFVTEGFQRNACKVDGEYENLILMGLLF